MQGYTAGAIAMARASRWRPIGYERGTKARLHALRQDLGPNITIAPTSAFIVAMTISSSPSSLAEFDPSTKQCGSALRWPEPRWPGGSPQRSDAHDPLNGMSAALLVFTASIWMSTCSTFVRFAPRNGSASPMKVAHARRCSGPARVTTRLMSMVRPGWKATQPPHRDRTLNHPAHQYGRPASRADAITAAEVQPAPDRDEEQPHW